MKFHKNPQWELFCLYWNVESKNTSADLNFLKVTKEEKKTNSIPHNWNYTWERKYGLKKVYVKQPQHNQVRQVSVFKADNSNSLTLVLMVSFFDHLSNNVSS